MTHEELQSEYPLFAMGVAEEPARSEIRAHLERRCEVCMAEMKRAKQIAAVIGASADPQAPSPKLRRRILAAAGVEQPRGFGLAPWFGLLAALSLVAAFYFGAREQSFAEELVLARRQMRQQDIQLTQFSEMMSILNGADTRVVAFGAGPKGRVFVNPSSGVVLIATNLPPVPAGKSYEMWVIPKGGKPAPAGLFQSQPNGTATNIFPGPVDAANLNAVAVSVEDAAGAAQPTTQPVIVAAMQ